MHAGMIWTLKIPEITVGVDDPVPGRFDPLLLFLHRLLAAEHAQGEFVHSGLQHGAELPLHVGLTVPGLCVLSCQLSVLGLGERGGLRRSRARKRHPGVLLLRLGGSGAGGRNRAVHCGRRACATRSSLLRCDRTTCLLLLFGEE